MPNLTPRITWVATIMAGTPVGQSASLTATLNLTQGWEMQVPFRVRFSYVSSDPNVYFYPSMDGGASYDTDPLTSISIGRIAAGTAQKSISLATGQYAVQLLNSGPNTATFMILTQIIHTAVQQN